MSMTTATLHPAAAQSLAAWHDIVASRDIARLETIVAPDAVFYSPTLHRGFELGLALMMALQTVITVFEDFTYHRAFAGDDGCSVVLEFSARVDDKSLKGIDMIRFDADGKIVEFEVMVRPLNALVALSEAMKARLGTAMVGFKAG